MKQYLTIFALMIFCFNYSILKTQAQMTSTPAQIDSNSEKLITFKVLKIDTGYATFYSNMWHGHRTSSGKIYHKDSLSCAHKKYPFGSKLRVTNLKNGKSVIVTVTDRGPHVKTRIIDLSGAAAKKIAMISDGVAKVSVELLE